MPSSTTHLGGDLQVASRFLLEIEGVEIGIFKEVTGLEVTVPTEPIKEGGQNGYVRLVPGRMDWKPIVFRRGVTQSDALLDWLSKTSGEGFAGNGNKVTRSSGAITAIGHTGNRMRSWELIDVMPVRWKGPDFGIDKMTTALEEELEIVHHGFRSTTHKAPS